MNTTRDIAMTNRLRQLRPRDAVLFVAVAAVVAVLGVVIGRELGIGGQATATLEQVSVDSSVAETTAATDILDGAQKANPDASETGGGTFRNAGEPPESQDAASALSLTLSAPDICETDHGFQGWKIGETPVTWKVTGGKGPYTLDIDGETRDASGAYVGQTGTASVSCALHTGDVHYEDERDEPYRYLEGEYVVDSGLKAIRAEVTDAKGDTAIATLDVYVILSTEFAQLLLRGHTYRIYGHLITIPEDADFRISELTFNSDGTSTISLELDSADPAAWITFDTDDFKETHRVIAYQPALADYARSGADDYSQRDATFDDLATSVGQLPTTSQSGQ